MLLEFRISNFRSIKDEQVLSFLPSKKIKKRTNPLIEFNKYNGIDILSTGVIYGPNNAGKSNTLQAFAALNYLISESHSFNLGDSLSPNEPFQFDINSQNSPVKFAIDFIAKDNIRYNYTISFDKKRIISEELLYYPRTDDVSRVKATKLYSRYEDTYKYGELRGNKKDIESKVLSNQLFLTKAVQDGFKQLNPVYKYFVKNVQISTYHDSHYDEIMLRALGEFIYNNKDSEITELIEDFILSSDTGIIGLEAMPEDKIPQIKFPEDFPEDKKNELIEEFMKKFQYQILTKHRLYENGKEIGVATLPLNEQSTGTKKFFTLLRYILIALRDGDLLIVDELDKSLHTEWTLMLLSLFQNPEINKNNAQLLFATHDTNLLKPEVFDKDQIYLVEKNRFGASSLYSLSSFTGLRQNTPIEKWYLEGAFGAIPQVFIDKINSRIINSNVI